MNKIIFIILILFSQSSFALTPDQMRNLKTVYQVCNKYHATDGTRFGYTCAAIALTETSAGLMLIGDQGKYPQEIVNSSLGVMQVRVKTALVIMKKFDYVRKFYSKYWHEDIDAVDKYLPIIADMRYSKYMWKHTRNYKWLQKYKKAKRSFKKYRRSYIKDKMLASRLLSDVKFDAVFAAHYLILNYELAQSRGYWNPWWKAMSRYNGGWSNKAYVKRVMKNMRIIRKIKKQLK